MALLSIENWRRIIAYNPWHFWGLADTTIAPVTSKCNDLVKKYAWQGADEGGREDILEAIENAEARLMEQMGFSPAPRWATKTLQFPKFHQTGVWRMVGRDADMRWLDVRLRDGHVQAIGAETRTLLGTQAVAYSDADGDTLNETFTVTIATTVTDPDQIHIYFKAADRLDGDAVSEKYRIHPIKVAISGGTATIKGKAWMLVKPILYEIYNLEAIDPTDANNFVTEVEVYRHYTNPNGTDADSAQSVFIWETKPYPAWASCCGCSDSSIDDSSTDPAAEAQGVARAGIRDSETGLVNIGRAAYNTTSGVWEAVNWGICRPPSRVLLRYYAGYPLEDGDMAKKMQVVVARLAAAEMPHRPAACDVANRELYRWQFDMARASGANDESYALVTREHLNNPFGTRRGHIYAWQFVQDFRKIVAFSM